MLRETHPRFQHVAIRASAGAGKTFQLTSRFIGLLARGELPDRILATTFTRKAAGEILGRVLLRLADAADDPEKCAALGEQIQEPGLTRERASAILVRLTRSLHRLRICTLDSFFGGLAGTFSLEVGLPPTYSIVEDDRDERLRLDAIEATLHEQGVARTVDLVRLLGKGDVGQRVSSEAAEIVRDLHPLYLEAPRPAWHRFDLLPTFDAETVEARCEEIGALQLPPALARGRDADLARVREHAWREFLSKGIAAKLLSGEIRYSRAAIPDDLAVRYRLLIDHARAVLLRILADQTSATWQLLHDFDAHYRRLQTTSRALRFDDVTRALAVRALHGRLDDIYYRLDARIAHLLLDEFQDTSRIQWQVLRPFAEEVVAHGDDSRSFFCVGDVKQAIYGWRGGEAEIFEALGTQLPTLSWKPLDQSFRSAPVIMETVNRVFGTIADNPALASYRAGAEAWAHGFAPHTTARTELTGDVTLLVAPEGEDDEQLTTTLRFAADRVASLWHRWPDRSIGVLVRKNQSVARVIFELRRRGVPASQEGGNPLTDSPAVTLMLSALTVADHPGDTAAVFHVTNSPLGKMLGLSRSKASAHTVALKIRDDLATRGYGAVLTAYADAIAPMCDPRDLNRLEQLLEVAHRAPHDEPLRPSEFVHRLRKLKVDDPSAARVRVMTVHQAKGLEFDIVVLPDLEDPLVRHGNTRVLTERESPDQPVSRVVRYADDVLASAFPDLGEMREAHDRHAVRESLSVLYVALTRAVHSLHLIVAPKGESLRATYAGVVRAALAPGLPAVPGAVLYETPPEAIAPGPPADAPRRIQLPARVELGPVPSPRERGLAHVTPTELSAADAVRLADLLSPARRAAARYGSVMHAWLERIRWLEDGEPDDDTLDAIAASFRIARGERDELKATFRATLERPTVRDALRLANYRTAHGAETEIVVSRELQFAMRDGDTLLSGTFDRVVEVRSMGRCTALDVIDFKTDAVVGREAAIERAKLHAPQLHAYRRAASRLYSVPPENLRTRMLFLNAGVSVDVDGSAGASHRSHAG